MSEQPIASTRVLDDVRLLLSTVAEELADGRKPYRSDIRRIIERGLAFRFAEYAQFLEKYGFLTLERKTDLLALTGAGDEVVFGDVNRSRSLMADAQYHFGDRMSEAAVAVKAVRGQRLDKRFMCFEVVGEGGLGRVHRGRQLSVDRPVAIKFMNNIFRLFTADQHEDILRRLQTAVRAQSQLVSPYIVQVLDQNVQHSPPYVVTELAPGGSLRDLLDEGPIEPTVALRFFIQVALGLKVAHDTDMLHRALKPENVLFDATGNIKLTDFGLTRVVEQGGASARQAYVGYGSVGYMAPELFRRAGHATCTADIYALGILLYEMLTGQLPGRRSPMPSEVTDGICTDLDEVFDVMTQDAATKRPPSIQAVLEMLWASPSIVAMLDPRQAPMYITPPVSLPGLKSLDGDAPEASMEAPVEVTQAPAEAPVALVDSPSPAPVHALAPAPTPAPTPAPAPVSRPMSAPVALVREVATTPVIEPVPAVVPALVTPHPAPLLAPAPRRVSAPPSAEVQQAQQVQQAQVESVSLDALPAEPFRDETPVPVAVAVMEEVEQEVEDLSAESLEIELVEADDILEVVEDPVRVERSAEHARRSIDERMERFRRG